MSNSEFLNNLFKNSETWACIYLEMGHVLRVGVAGAKYSSPLKESTDAVGATIKYTIYHRPLGSNSNMLSQVLIYDVEFLEN